MNLSAASVSLKRQASATESENPLPPNPFVGLRPFDSEESLLFFGRRKHVVELLRQLHRTQFLAVIGSSGCGKSSLIRAGLIPKLKAGFLVEESERWRLAIMKPGESPLTNLAEKLLEVVPDSSKTTSAFATDLRLLGVDAVVDLLNEPLANEGANLLLVVDQFEELFRYDRPSNDVQDNAGGDAGNALSPEEKEQQRLAQRELRREEAATFVSLLLAAVKQNKTPIYVVITMRSDFLGDCDAFPGLPEMINKSLYLVPRLDRKHREEVVENPIKLYGKNIAPRLLDTVVNDVGDESDQLPVMQHALMRTWEEWARDPQRPEVIDLTHYQAAGTISNALSQDANRALQELNKEQERIAELMFQALVDTDVQGRNVRRPVHLKELALIADVRDEQMLEVVNHFRRGGRLFLTLSSEKLKDNPLVDISHESFIRQWSKLREWVNSENTSKEIYTGIVAAARRHLTAGWGLLRETELEVASTWWDKRQPNPAWAARYSPDFKIAEKFLHDSKEQRKKDDEERVRKQIEQAENFKIRQQNKKLKLRAYALGAVTVFALASLVVSVLSWRVARAEGEKGKLLNQDLTRVADQLRTSLENEKALRINEKALREKADEQTKLATAATKHATEQAALAEEQRKKAEAATAAANKQTELIAEAKRDADAQTVIAQRNLKLRSEAQTKLEESNNKLKEANDKLALRKNEVITTLGEQYAEALTLAASADNIDAAEESYKKILSIYKDEQVTKGELSILLILGRLFDGSLNVNKPTKAINYYNQALPLFDNGNEVERAKKIETLVKLGDLRYRDASSGESAVNLYREAIGLGYDAASDDRHVYLKMADYYASSSQPSILATAVNYYQLELAALENKIADAAVETTPDDHGHVDNGLNNPRAEELLELELSALIKLGTLYSRLGENDSATETYQKAQDVANGPPLDITTDEVLTRIGVSFNRPELKSKREDYFNWVIQRATTPAAKAKAYLQITEALNEAQEYEQSLTYLNDAAKLLESDKFGAIAPVLARMGQTYEKLNRYDDAIQAYRTALRIMGSGSLQDLVRARLNKVINLKSSR